MTELMPDDEAVKRTCEIGRQQLEEDDKAKAQEIYEKGLVQVK